MSKAIPSHPPCRASESNVAPGCKQSLPEVVPAGLTWRFLATQIDWLMCCLVFGISFGVLQALLPIPAVSNSNYGVMVMLTVPFIYAAWAESSSHGATVGKRMLRMNVLRVNGSRVSLARALVRQVLRLATLVIIPAAFLYISWSTEKLSLHDLAAQTVVVRNRIVGPACGHAASLPTWARSRLDVLVTTAAIVLALASLGGFFYWVSIVLLKGFAMQGVPAR
jgi:uncharacterized RDD family membrane protein YckC